MSPTGSAPTPPSSARSRSASTTPNAGRDVVAFLKRYWLAIVLVIVAVVFIVTNTNKADLTIGWATISSPLWLTLTVTVLVGFVVGWFVGRRQSQ